MISSETECSNIIFSAKKKRQIYCNLHVEDFGKSSAKLRRHFYDTKSANILLRGEAAYAIHSMFPLDILELYVLTVLDGKQQDCLSH